MKLYKDVCFLSLQPALGPQLEITKNKTKIFYHKHQKKLNQQFKVVKHWGFFCETMDSDGVYFLTVPPAVELVLQPGDGVPQGLILLFLPLILLLPLLCCKLDVHTDSVLDSLCSGCRK